jgi:hypothetical protein
VWRNSDLRLHHRTGERWTPWPKGLHRPRDRDRDLRGQPAAQQARGGPRCLKRALEASGGLSAALRRVQLQTITRTILAGSPNSGHTVNGRRLPKPRVGGSSPSRATFELEFEHAFYQNGHLRVSARWLHRSADDNYDSGKRTFARPSPSTAIALQRVGCDHRTPRACVAGPLRRTCFGAHLGPSTPGVWTRRAPQHRNLVAPSSPFCGPEGAAARQAPRPRRTRNGRVTRTRVTSGLLGCRCPAAFRRTRLLMSWMSCSLLSGPLPSATACTARSSRSARSWRWRCPADHQPVPRGYPRYLRRPFGASGGLSAAQSEFNYKR